MTHAFEEHGAATAAPAQGEAARVRVRLRRRRGERARGAAGGLRRRRRRRSARHRATARSRPRSSGARSAGRGRLGGRRRCPRGTARSSAAGAPRGVVFASSPSRRRALGQGVLPLALLYTVLFVPFTYVDRPLRRDRRWEAPVRRRFHAAVDDEKRGLPGLRALRGEPIDGRLAPVNEADECASQRLLTQWHAGPPSRGTRHGAARTSSRVTIVVDRYGLGPLRPTATSRAPPVRPPKVAVIDPGGDAAASCASSSPGSGASCARS